MIVLGRLGEPYGLRGWLKLHCFADDPEAWGALASWWVAKTEQGPWQEFALESLQPHGEGLKVRLAGIDDRTAAEALRGWWVGAPRDLLPEPAEDEYYWADLLGLSVKNRSGVVLGQVAGLLETGANDVLRVASDGQPEILIPFVATAVLEVDRAAGVILVDWDADWV